MSGPGYSCPLKEYTDKLNYILPDFISDCRVPASYPQYLDFWWNYNITNTLNYQVGQIPYQDDETTASVFDAALFNLGTPESI
jgi:acid phosphatase